MLQLMQQNSLPRRSCAYDLIYDLIHVLSLQALRLRNASAHLTFKQENAV
jgi:hypothetical protein